MKFKFVLLGSVAAFAPISGALAANAVVSAEPEAVEYVRVCDAFGTGYFYIPGTETCLKIEGYVRFQVNGGPTDVSSDWDAMTRGQVQFTAKSDTEYGPLTGVMVLQTNADNANSQVAKLDSAYLDIAGIRAGLFYSWWDAGLSGETDDLASGPTLHNSLRYQYEVDGFFAGVSVDELEDSKYYNGNSENNIGVAGGIGGKADGFTYQVTAGYDTDNEEGALRALGTVAIGPGTFGLGAAYASGPNAYYNAAEWAVAAEFAIKATDKLKITPGVQYYGNYGVSGAEFVDNNDAWKAGVTMDYQIAENLYAKASVQHLKPDTGADVTSGYFRLQRAF